MTSESSSSPSNDDNSINNYKIQFYREISSYTNRSTNNPLFSAARYNQMIELLVNTKLKTPADRNTQEIACLRTYDVVDFGGNLKLIKNRWGI